MGENQPPQSNWYGPPYTTGTPPVGSPNQNTNTAGAAAELLRQQQEAIRKQQEASNNKNNGYY